MRTIRLKPELCLKFILPICVTIVIIILMMFYLKDNSTSHNARIIPKHKFFKDKEVDDKRNNQQDPQGLPALGSKQMADYDKQLLEKERNAFLEWKAEEASRLNDMKVQLRSQFDELKLERAQLEDQKEEMAAAVKLGLYDKFLKPQELDHEQKRQVKRERELYLNSIGPSDPQQFLGLNSSVVRGRYPGIVFLPSYRLRKFIDMSDDTMGMQGDPNTINDMDDLHAEERFYELVGNKQMECADMERFGSEGDGGWDLCVSQPYAPTQGDCLVYSFGIDNDFSFDDGIAGSRGCKVKAYDPSMNYADHKHATNVWFYRVGIGRNNTVNAEGWKLKTLGSLLQESGHSERTIDVLKIDVDYNEWDALHGMFEEDVLKNVKQLAIEIHTSEVIGIKRPSNKMDYWNMYSSLLQLEQLGFRKCHIHYNQWGSFLSPVTGKHRTCCYEFTYLNLHFL